MTKHPFLSDAWIDEAEALREEFADQLSAPPVAVAINVVVTDIPHRDGDLHGHIDSSDGDLIIERDHLDSADLTLTVDYDTAKAVFITQDQQAVMQAFFGGKILVEGDASQLLAMQAQAPGAEAVEMYDRLRSFTAED